MAQSEVAPTPDHRGSSEPLAPPVHAFLLSWRHHHARAAAIAAQLVGQVDSLTVVYTEPDDDAAGAGNWVRVPDEWYYGRKHAWCLEQFETGILLQIQADAICDDWPGLVQACRDDFASYPEIGVWAPQVVGVPWTVQATQVGPLGDSHLVSACQTDCTVWAMDQVVADRLRSMEVAKNNFGWSIDWAACAAAWVRGRLVVRNPRLQVVHPVGSSYEHREAIAQSEEFLRGLSADEYAQYKLMRDFCQLRSSPSWRQIADLTRAAVATTGSRTLSRVRTLMKRRR